MRRLPDDNLGYPTQVCIEDRYFGSAFFFGDDNQTYLVSATHVFFDSKRKSLLGGKAILISPPRNPSEATQNRFEIDLERLQRDDQIRVDWERDIVLIRLFNITKRGKDLGGYVCEGVSGVTGLSAAESGHVRIAKGTIKQLKDVLVSNDAFVFGYPVSIGLVPNQQFDSQRPLIRSGIVAGVFPEKGTIILDCAVFKGNSGGPVVELEPVSMGNQLRVIGVVIQFVPFVERLVSREFGYINQIHHNSGYSIAASMDSVVELLGTYAKAKPK